MSQLPDDLMNLQLLVTEANLLRFGLLQPGQRISPVSLVGFRDTPQSRAAAERHIAWVSEQAELVYMQSLKAQRLESIKAIRADQRAEAVSPSRAITSSAGAGPSSRSEGKTPFTIHYAPCLGDRLISRALASPSLLESGQISHRRWTWTEYSDYLDLIDPFLSNPKRRRPRAGWIPLGELSTMRASWFCEHDSNLYGEMGRMVSEFASAILHPERSNGGSLEDYPLNTWLVLVLYAIFLTLSFIVQRI